MPQFTEKDLGEVAQAIGNLARDAAYVVVGLGVLGVQRLQVQRVALEDKLPEDLRVKSEERLEALRKEIVRQVQQLDKAIEGAVNFIETSLEPIEDQLPGGARDLAKKAHEQARGVRIQIREVVVPAA